MNNDKSLMCMSCGHDPCVCGDRYASLSNKELFIALMSIRDELVSRNYSVSEICINDQPLNEFYKYNVVVRKKFSVFNKEEIDELISTKNFPNQWIVRILGSTCIDDLFKSMNKTNEDKCPLIAMMYYFVLVHLADVVDKCVFFEFTNYIAKCVFQHGTFNRNVIDKSPVKCDDQVSFLHNIIQDMSTIKDERPEGYLELEAFYDWVYCEHDKVLQNPKDRFNRFCKFITSLCGIPEDNQITVGYFNIAKYSEELYYIDEALLTPIRKHTIFKNPDIALINVK